tara:strand:- start:433 stop:1449 length:1017 start_codon:yes stop_codon:yes gene_type:complete
MAISNALLSTTLYSIRDKEVDELFKKTAFLDGVKQAGGIETESGGIKIQRPLSVYEHSTITSFSSGYEPVSLAVADTMVPAVYDWAYFNAPIVINELEESRNSGEKAIVKILEARMRNVMGMLRRDLNGQILAGGSATLGDLNTLNGEASASGFLENGTPDAANQTNTVGGQNKATLNVRGWFNQRQTAGSAFGTAGLPAMNQIYADTNDVALMGECGLIIASKAAFVNYKRSLQANERYVDSKVLDGGRMALAFAGAMLEADSAMPANTGVGTDEYSMYFLNFEGIKLVMMDGYDFALSPFIDIPGTIGRSARLQWQGQLIADHLGSQGVLVDGDTF